MPLYESSERPVGAVDIDGVQEVNYDLFPVHFELIRRHASNLSSEVVGLLTLSNSYIIIWFITNGNILDG